MRNEDVIMRCGVEEEVVVKVRDEALRWHDRVDEGRNPKR